FQPFGGLVDLVLVSRGGERLLEKGPGLGLLLGAKELLGIVEDAADGIPPQLWAGVVHHLRQEAILGRLVLLHEQIKRKPPRLRIMTGVSQETLQGSGRQRLLASLGAINDLVHRGSNPVARQRRG